MADTHPMVVLVHQGKETGRYQWAGAWPPPGVIAVADVRAPGRPPVKAVMDAVDWVLGYAIAPHSTVVSIYDRDKHDSDTITTPAAYTRRVAVTTTQEQS